MMNSKFRNRIGKACALVAATLILPALTCVGQNAQGNQNQGGNSQGNSVPEGGPGIVLLTTAIGAILLFSWRQSSRAKADSQR
jgi:hypothetical protein